MTSRKTDRTQQQQEADLIKSLNIVHGALKVRPGRFFVLPRQPPQGHAVAFTRQIVGTVLQMMPTTHPNPLLIVSIRWCELSTKNKRMLGEHGFNAIAVGWSRVKHCP